MFSALDNVIHSDFADPNLTFTTEVGTTLNQILSRSSVTVTINIVDAKSQPEQVSNLVESDLRLTNCNITGFTNNNYNQYQFTMHSHSNDGSAICRVQLENYDFSDKANRPYPGGFDFYWICDTIPPQINSIIFGDPQFRTSGEFGSTSPGGGYTDNYHTQKQTQNVTITISEPNTDFSPSHVDLTNCYFSTGLTNPTGDTVTWTGAITASVGDQESKIRIEANKFRDLALGSDAFNNSGTRVNYNTSAFERAWEWDTTSRTITSFTSTGSSGSNVNSGDLTNDGYITITIVINKGDTNFFSKGTGVFEVNGGYINAHEISHQGGNTVFTAIVRPNSNQGTVTVKVKDNSFQSRSMTNNTGSSTFTWNYDHIPPTTTFRFSNDSQSLGMTTTSPISGKLNFTETIYNLVTSGGSTSVREVQKGLGAVTFNTSSTSGSSWTWSINIPSNTTQVSPPLTFQFYVGSVADGASNLTNDPGVITVPFSNEPVDGTLYFDTNNSGSGDSTSVSHNFPTIYLNFPEAVSGVTINSISLPAPYQSGTFTALSSTRYKWVFTALSGSPTGPATNTISFNSSGITVDSGKPLGTVNSLQWSYDNRPLSHSFDMIVPGPLQGGGSTGADNTTTATTYKLRITFSRDIVESPDTFKNSLIDGTSWDPIMSNLTFGTATFISNTQYDFEFTTSSVSSNTTRAVNVWGGSSGRPGSSSHPYYSDSYGNNGINFGFQWYQDPAISVTVEAWGWATANGVYPSLANGYDMTGTTHTISTPSEQWAPGGDPEFQFTHQLQLWIKFSHGCSLVSDSIAWQTSYIPNIFTQYFSSGIFNVTPSNGTGGVYGAYEDRIWQKQIRTPSQPSDDVALNGPREAAITFSFGNGVYDPYTPIVGTVGTTTMPTLTHNWSTIPSGPTYELQFYFRSTPRYKYPHLYPRENTVSEWTPVPFTSDPNNEEAATITSGIAGDRYHMQVQLYANCILAYNDANTELTEIYQFKNFNSYDVPFAISGGDSTALDGDAMACAHHWSRSISTGGDNADESGYTYLSWMLQLRHPIEASDGGTGIGVTHTGTVQHRLNMNNLFVFGGVGSLVATTATTLTWNFDTDSNNWPVQVDWFGWRDTTPSHLLWHPSMTQSSNFTKTTNGADPCRGEVGYSRSLSSSKPFKQAHIEVGEPFNDIAYASSMSTANFAGDSNRIWEWYVTVHSHFAGVTDIIVHLNTSNQQDPNGNVPYWDPTTGPSWQIRTLSINKPSASSASFGFIFNPAAAGYSIGFNNSCTITSESPSTLINGDTAFATDYTFRITFDYALDASLSIVKLQSTNASESYTIDSLTEITGLIVDVNITSTTLSTHTFTIDSTDYGDVYGNPGTTASFTWTQYATEAEAIHGSNLIAYDGFVLKYLSGSQLLIDFDIHKNTTLVEKNYETLNSNNNEGWAGYDTSNNFHPYMEKYTRIGPSGVNGTNLSNNAYESTIKYGELSGNDYLQVRAWYTNGSTDVGEYLLPPKFYAYVPNGSNSDWDTTEPLQEITSGSWIEQPLSLRPTIQTIHNNTAIHQVYNSGSTNWETKRVEDIVDDKNNYRTARTPSNTTGSGGCGYNEWKLTNWLTTWYPYSKIYMVFEELDND